MKPTIGRIVLALVDPSRNNGTDVCPAIITRIWGPAPHPANGRALINLKTLNDGLVNEWLTSVVLFDTEDEAREHGAHSCFWPPRA